MIQQVLTQQPIKSQKQVQKDKNIFTSRQDDIQQDGKIKVPFGK